MDERLMVQILAVFLPCARGKIWTSFYYSKLCYLEAYHIAISFFKYLFLLKYHNMVISQYLRCAMCSNFPNILLAWLTRWWQANTISHGVFPPDTHFILLGRKRSTCKALNNFSRSKSQPPGFKPTIYRLPILSLTTRPPRPLIFHI